MVEKWCKIQIRFYAFWQIQYDNDQGIQMGEGVVMVVDSSDKRRRMSECLGPSFDIELRQSVDCDGMSIFWDDWTLNTH